MHFNLFKKAEPPPEAHTMPSSTEAPIVVSQENTTAIAGSGDKSADTFRKIQQELMNQINKIPCKCTV